MLDTVKYLIGSAGSSGFGSKSTAEKVTECVPDLRSVTAVITGATSGIGFETARVLAMRGARLVLPARNIKAAEETRNRITSQIPGSDILVFPLDLSSLASVASFATHFISLHLPLHLLINNAGKFSYENGKSEDGVEMTFATNYLGHFLLTELLMEKMIETAKSTRIQARIVNVSSGIHGWFSGDWLAYLDLVTRHKIPYDPTQAYALSKLANVLHTNDLADRLKKIGANVTVNSVDPGIVRTRINRERDSLFTDIAFFLLSKLLKTIPQAAATTCYVATSPALAGVTGKYFAHCNEAASSPLSTDPQEALRLRDFSESITAQFASEANPLTNEDEGRKSFYEHR